MPAAGETIIAGKVPGERISTASRTSNSAAITTTETVTDTVVAATVVGRIYRVRWVFGSDTTVATDIFLYRIREDSATGTVLNFSRIADPVNSNIGHELEAEYTADATEDKTFVATLVRESGTGSITAVGAATAPAYLYVDYIRG